MWTSPGEGYSVPDGMLLGEQGRVRDESVMENVAIIWGDWMQHAVLDTDIRTYICT